MLILKSIWKCSGPRLVKIFLKKMNRVERFILPDFQTYYKAMVIQRYSYEDRFIGSVEQNRVQK